MKDSEGYARMGSVFVLLWAACWIIAAFGFYPVGFLVAGAFMFVFALASNSCKNDALEEESE